MRSDFSLKTKRDRKNIEHVLSIAFGTLNSFLYGERPLLNMPLARKAHDRYLPFLIQYTLVGYMSVATRLLTVCTGMYWSMYLGEGTEGVGRVTTLLLF